MAENALVRSAWIEAVAEATAEIDGYPVRGAGCYGRSHYTEASADLMQQLLSGIPVQVDYGRN